MERLVKERRLDWGEDPGNGRVERSGATRDKYWNFERVYYVWTTECVIGGHNSSKKRKGQPHVKERAERCDSLIGQMITLIQDTNRVLKENQLSKKYKYLGVMEDINN
jgi:hypothetical protein